MQENNEVTTGIRRNVLLIYRTMIPSIRLCGHSQLEALAEEGLVSYRAVAETKIKKQDMEWADVVILGRTDSWYECRLADALFKAGRKLLYILDDDLLNIPPEISSAAYYGQKDTQMYIRGMIGMSDGILSPSPVLLGKYAVDGRKGYLIEEPAIDPVEYTARDLDKTVRIGFAGSIDRTGDVERILKGALLTIKRKYGDRVEFEFFGAIPSFAEQLGATCYEYTESYEEYRGVLNLLEWDIGLAPMPATKFHACKHYNKFVEYAAAGIAGIYSDVPPYSRLTEFQDCVILCENSEQSWVDAISLLIDNPEGREMVRENACRTAAGKLSVRETANGVLEMLESLPQRSISGMPVKIPLFYCKAVNLWKRFVSACKSGSLKRRIKKLFRIGAE
ncbi:MAG: hypothetical protein J5643_08215 [Lachnospiraceae bacterium]|nr:hypothetical protein [Lachnospiraceae bacterium]